MATVPAGKGVDDFPTVASWTNHLYYPVGVRLQLSHKPNNVKNTLKGELILQILVIGAQMITVLLVDDHASVRNSLRYLLEATDDIKVVATASNGADAVAQTAFLCPDVAVVDISMPQMDGIETARQIRANCRSTRVMMLSIYGNSEYVQRALEVGALGFVLKNVIGEDLLAAIRALSMGKRYFSEMVAEFAQKYISQKGKDSWAG